LKVQNIIKLAAGALAALAVAAALLTTGSGSSAQTGDARIRVLHAVPDAPAVDVYLNDAEAIGDLEFNNITAYTAVPAGSYSVKVYPSSANGTGTPVIDVPALALAAGQDYTVAAVGTLATIEPLVLEDNNAAPAAGKAHIRVVHASPDAPNVDIYAAGAGVIVPNLAFKAASDYLPLDAGSYDLQVRVAGTETVALDLPDTALAAGTVYTAFAVGLADGQPALTVNLTSDAVAQQATATAAPTSAPTSAPTATPAAAPSSGGPIDDGGMSLAVWALIAVGATAMIAGAAGVALARRNIDN
jgi:hypothetical protein